jgi:cytochrome c peroxidase
VSAFPAQPPRQRSRRTGSYSGGSSPSPSLATGPQKRARLTHEWRTPPLWGVADSPPFLHDGRAGTLDEAIRLHSGEGERAAEAYRELTPAERSQLLTFLGTLRAPHATLAMTSKAQTDSPGN